eukprot:TRINITY_DN2331_c0_g1_i6.p1 TRINITY_DN2331_c0_g1~~TRINITY_DN2331_c0_g1_i6.p1  ORF type:complete len:495 (+),score=123.65 TRINITY_DN2331_c0_g1_i6:46-1485(+)
MATNPRNTIYPITPTYLYNLLQDSAIQKVVVDLRSQDVFDRKYIRTAINIPVLGPASNTSEEHLITPSALKAMGASSSHDHISPITIPAPPSEYEYLPTLLDKDSHVSLTEVDNLLNNRNKNKVFKSRGVVFNCVVVYDDGEEYHAKRFIDALIEEGKFTHFHWLEGGFKRFESVYPFMCSSLEVKARGGSYPSEIDQDFMFLGSHENAKNKDQLQELGITHVINMAGELEDSHPNDFEYLHVKIDDTDKDNISEYFDHALKFIENARAANSKAKILVHCAMGISRSSSIAIAYLMKKNKWSYETAHKYVKQARSCIKPNPGFTNQLKSFEAHVLEERVTDDGQVERNEVQSGDPSSAVRDVEGVMERAAMKIMAVERGMVGGPIGEPMVSTTSTTVTYGPDGTPLSSSSSSSILPPGSNDLGLHPAPVPTNVSVQDGVLATTFKTITLESDTQGSSPSGTVVTTSETTIALKLPDTAL